MTPFENPLISVAELAGRLHDPSLCPLDASVDLAAPRFDGDYVQRSGEAGWLEAHIPGSRHADLTSRLSDPDAPFSFALPHWDVLAHRLGELGVDDTRTPVLYDRSDGFWAARLWWTLRSIGVKALVLDGGWRAWLDAKQPIEKGDIAPAKPGLLQARPCPELWANMEHVLAIVEGRESGTLINALSSAMFAGTVPTRYSRRGHIPGSRNLPARMLMDAQGHFLAPDLATPIVAPALAEAARPLIVYCGGGISACSIALSLTILGERDVAVYDGSLQEWSAHPDLPLVRTD